jgi:TPR repeat protein
MHEEENDEKLQNLKAAALDFFHAENFEDLNKVLAEMIKFGSPWAMHYLAGSYTYGLGVEKNLEEANNLYLNSANLGFTEAQLAIGSNLLNGYGITKDIDQGIRYLNLASDQGSGYASFLLAEYYLGSANSQLTDHPLALRYYRRGVDQGEHRAMQRLAWVLAEGQITEKNLEEALSLNIKAADLGNQFAAYNAAGAFRYGRGTQIDCYKAIAYYEIASNFGLMEAMHNLGTMYFNAEGIAKDIEKANEWYLKAANCGSGLSSYCLGLIALNGDRGSVDKSFAFAWFSIALAQDNTESEKQLEDLHEILSSEETNKALFILTAMSERGFPWAQHALGCLYLSGKLVSPEKNLALKWLSAASEQGLSRAKNELAKAFGTITAFSSWHQ